MPEPLSVIVFLTLVPLRLLSVIGSERENAPAVVGAELMGNKQDAPIASIAACEEV